MHQLSRLQTDTHKPEQLQTHRFNNGNYPLSSCALSKISRRINRYSSLSGDGDDAWKIASVTLKVTEKFRYFFQGIRGSAGSSGAILIDDITLSETVCPSAVWKIQNFTGLLATAPVGSVVKTPCFYNSEGYAYGISVYPNGRDIDVMDYVGMSFHLCSGDNDAVMEWPVKNRQITITAMDQDPDAKLRMSATRSYTTGGYSIIYRQSGVDFFCCCCYIFTHFLPSF